MMTTVGASKEPFFLKKTLNPVMSLFMGSSGGSVQDADILVEVLAATVRLAGGWDGTEIYR